jgi:NAD+ synthase
VQAQLRRFSSAGIGAYLVRRGDTERGTVLVRLVGREEPIAAIVAAGFDRDLVMRVERMLNLAEYKRRQAAPGVKITLRNFGRDRRYPIVNRFRDPGTPPPAPDTTLVADMATAKSDMFDF